MRFSNSTQNQELNIVQNDLFNKEMFSQSVPRNAPEESEEWQGRQATSTPTTVTTALQHFPVKIQPHH